MRAIKVLLTGLSCIMILALVSSASATETYIPDGDVVALINALEVANNEGGSHTINLSPNGIYLLTAAYENTENGLPSIAPGTEVTINGNGAMIKREDGTLGFRFFFVEKAWGLDPNGALTINDLTLTNGNMSNGGALHCNGVLTLHRVTISDNHGANRGAIDGEHCASLTITDSNIVNNTAADHVGGVYINSDATIIGSTFSGNIASVGNAGAIHVQSGEVLIENSTISDNAAGADGGGILNMYGNLIIRDSFILGNSVKNQGGGVKTSCLLTVENTEFSGNQTTAPGYGGGGAIHYDMNDSICSGISTITNSFFSNNSAGYQGGAILIGNYDGGSTQPVMIAESQFTGNVAAGQGGAFFTHGPLILERSTVDHNSALQGGGVYHENSTVTIVNSTLSGNFAAIDGGGLYSWGTMNIVNSTLAENDSAAASAIFHKREPLHIKNSLIWGSAGLNCQTEQWFNFLPVGVNFANDASCGGFVNIDAMLGPLADNSGPTPTHALQAGSPALDAAVDCTLLDGATPIDTDQRGKPRPFDGDNDSIAVCDLGAYEVAPIIEASLSHDWVQAYGFAAGTTLELDIYEHAGGEHLYSGPWAYNPINGWWMDVGIFGIDLEAGAYIEVSDGATVKQLELVELSLTDFDHQANTVSGVAEPGQEVEVQASGYVETVLSTGSWTALFSADLDENAWISAKIYDNDGDITLAESPWIEANPAEDWLAARNFSPNASVLFEVFDLDGITPMMDPQVAGTDSDGHTEINVGELVDVLPGYVVKVTDDITGFSKTLKVEQHTLDLVDSEANFAEGTAPPDAHMILHLVDESVHYIFDFQADSNGNWRFDFNQPGVELDITEYAQAYVWVIEPDSDVTSDNLPRFQASLRDHWIQGWSFNAGAQLTVEFYDSPLSPEPFRSVVVVTDSNGAFWLNRDGHGVQFVPGDFLKVSWMTGETNYHKALELVDVRVDPIDVDGDIVSGIAPVAAWVGVSVGGDGPEHAQMDVQVLDGTWSAAFGPDFDIVPGMWADARVADADSDATVAQSPIPPTFHVNISNEVIEGWGWTENATVTVEISGVDQWTQVATSENSSFVLELWREDIDLQPGQQVIVIDDVSGFIKRHTVTDLVVNAVDTAANSVSGTTDSPFDVQLWVHPGIDGSFISATPFAGNWIGDFSPFDLDQGSAGPAVQYDEDGDGTWVEWAVPNPRFTIQPDHRWVQGVDWPMGVTITLIIDDDTDPDNGVIYQDTQISAPAEWDPNLSAVWFDLGAVETLARGQYVRMIDGNIIKDSWIADLAFDSVDATADTASGRGPAGAEGGVYIQIGELSYWREITVSASGEWSADFSDEAPDFEHIQDANVVVWDEDGDETMAHLRFPVLHAVPARPEVHGHDWDPEAFVTLSIEDPETGTRYTAAKYAYEDPWCGEPCFDLKGVWDLQPGQIVTMSDDLGHTLTVHVTRIAISSVDYSADTISGSAEPGSEVWVYVFDLWDSPRREVANADGRWTADFSVVGDDDFEWGVFDLAPGIAGRAIQFENQGPDDGTLAYWPRPPEFIDGWLSPNPASITQEVTITADFIGFTYDGGLSSVVSIEYKCCESEDWKPMQVDGGAPTVRGSAKLVFDAPGVYPIAVRAFDTAGEMVESFLGFLAVYDPEGGFVTGGGWFWSPVEAYKPDPTLEGKATFGFVSKYQKGAQIPSGNTEFQFHAGSLNFRSRSYDWLVVTGSNYARFKGSGAINGKLAPNGKEYKFMIWAGDGMGSEGADTFRIKIWYEVGGEEIVVYDNLFDQAIGGGNIVVHTKK